MALKGYKWPLEKRSSIEKLLRDHVAITESCWIWTGALKEKGYGQVRFEGKNRRAHRLMYEHFKGPIPEGLMLDHLCRVRRCVNPDHLEPVTAKVNSERGYWATKSHCSKGHELSGENVNVHAITGRRKCRACKSESDKKYRLKFGPIQDGPKVTCIKGHPFSEDNTSISLRGRHTVRICKTCTRERSRAFRQKQKNIANNS